MQAIEPCQQRLKFAQLIWNRSTVIRSQKLLCWTLSLILNNLAIKFYFTSFTDSRNRLSSWFGPTRNSFEEVGNSVKTKYGIRKFKSLRELANLSILSILTFRIGLQRESNTSIYCNKNWTFNHGNRENSFLHARY